MWELGHICNSRTLGDWGRTTPSSGPEQDTRETLKRKKRVSRERTEKAGNEHGVCEGGVGSELMV